VFIFWDLTYFRWKRIDCKITLLAIALILPIQAFSACDAKNGIQPYCGISAPEDIVHVPGTQFLIASQLLDKSGALILFDTKTGEHKRFTPFVNAGYPPDRQKGDKTCSIPPSDFSFHGIDLIRDTDGILSLLAIYHGEQDSVQLFGIIQSYNSIDLQWQGCVSIADNIILNDVAALPQGGFVATASSRAVQGLNKPWQVIKWQKSSGTSVVMSFPTGYGNGISASANGKLLFVNDMTNGKVIKATLDQGEILAEANIVHPDNNSWTDGGQLLVTSVAISTIDQIMKCIQSREGHCNLPFLVTQLDPLTMTTKLLFSHDGKTVFGGATVAVQLGDKIYLGAFAGNRMASVLFDENHDVTKK